MAYTFIEGGVTAAQGFTASGVHCGIRRNKSKADLALIFSEKPCAAAGVYTLNKVKGAPILVTKRNLHNGTAQAVVCNSGNANTCNADGEEKAWRMCEITGQALGLDPSDIIVASTGVIGEILPIEPIEEGVPEAAKELNRFGSEAAAMAIMTTDTVKKEVAVELELDGKKVHIGGIAKGSGMIHPNMGTMLCFLTTDAAISTPMVQKALQAAADKSFNMVSIDGDTSTNDTMTLMANGMAGNTLIDSENEDYGLFYEALEAMCIQLARMIAADGEGASRLLVCKLTGAKDEETARVIAKAVICSSLVKAAMFGADANWGRVLCAIGYSGAEVDVTKVDVSFASKAGTVDVCKDGAGIPFDEDVAKKVLLENEVDIIVVLHDGEGYAEAYGCDLTYEYVRINGDYRT